MKKISSLMALALVSVMVLASCRPSVIFSHLGGKTLEPSGKTVTKTYSNLDFQSIDFSAVGKVEFVQTAGGKCSVTITAPENYIPIYIVKVEKGELKIYNDDDYNINDDNIKDETSRIRNFCGITTSVSTRFPMDAAAPPRRRSA